MGMLKKLPKIEKRHLVASGALTAVALTAFVAGTVKSSKTPVSAPEVQAAHHEPDAHGDEHAPTAAHPPNRTPAAEPSAVPGEEELYEEEEVEVQVARHAVPAKASTVHTEVHESSSSPVPTSAPRSFFSRIFGVYADAWESVHAKVRAIHEAEEENKQLKLENAYLRVMVETGKFTARAEAAREKTETVGKKLATAAGSRAARSIASIRYQFPENLLPEQLLALGVGYFKEKDDEKAAVILHFLTELDDEKSFRTAANYLMAGIAFYRLEHYKNAATYFDRIGKMTETDPETTKAKRQAAYWQALVAERTQDRPLAQRLLLDNLEKDPLTQEARWVNPQGVPAKTRSPASHAKEEESHEGHSPAHH